VERRRGGVRPLTGRLKGHFIKIGRPGGRHIKMFKGRFYASEEKGKYKAIGGRTTPLNDVVTQLSRVPVVGSSIGATRVTFAGKGVEG